MLVVVQGGASYRRKLTKEERNRLVLLSYIATMSGQFFPGSCGDLNPACCGSLAFLKRERVSLRCV